MSAPSAGRLPAGRLRRWRRTTAEVKGSPASSRTDFRGVTGWCRRRVTTTKAGNVLGGAVDDRFRDRLSAKVLTGVEEQPAPAALLHDSTTRADAGDLRLRPGHGRATRMQPSPSRRPPWRGARSRSGRCRQAPRDAEQRAASRAGRPMVHAARELLGPAGVLAVSRCEPGRLYRSSSDPVTTRQRTTVDAMRPQQAHRRDLRFGQDDADSGQPSPRRPACSTAMASAGRHGCSASARW